MYVGKLCHQQRFVSLSLTRYRPARFSHREQPRAPREAVGRQMVAVADTADSAGGDEAEG